MSRSLSANASAAANLKEGLEPVLQLWIAYGGGRRYASKSITDSTWTWDGRILNFSGLKSSQKTENTASVAEVSITLDDSDNELKDLFETQNLENVTAEIRQFFHGLGGAGTLLFEGEIINPIEWDEGEQTATITVESLVRSDEVGFSIEDGEGGVNNEQAVGKMWPLVFGKAMDVPAPLITRNPITELDSWISFAGKETLTGLHKIGVVVADDGEKYSHINLPWNKEFQSYNIDFDSGVSTIAFNTFRVKDKTGFPATDEDNLIILDVDGVGFKGWFEVGDHFTVTEPNAVKYHDVEIKSRVTGDDDVANPFVFWIEDGDVELINQHIYFKKGDIPGAWFVNGGRFDTVEGDGPEERIVRRVTRQENNKCWLSERIEKKAGAWGSFLRLSSSDTITEVRALSLTGLIVPLEKAVQKICEIARRRSERKGVTDTVGETDKSSYGAIIDVLNTIKDIKTLFWGRGEGTTVRLWGQQPDIYVANAVPSTAVTGVFGLRKYPEEDETFFVPIPKRLYTVTLDDPTLVGTGLGPTNMTSIRFDAPLSSIKEQGWKDEIYVTVTSTLSDNTATQIKWIIDNYTNLSTDAGSFGTVAGQISGTPSNFALLEQEDALQLVEDMAWQARCGLLIDGEDVKIILLAAQPNSSLTIDEENCEFATVEVSTTERTDIITRLVGKYLKGYGPEGTLIHSGDLRHSKSRRRIRREHRNHGLAKFDLDYTYSNNVHLYGLVEEEYDMFIYNNEDAVARSLDFWGHRYSNIWRKANLSSFHEAMKLEIFDGVNLNFGSSDILGTTTIRAIVQATNNTVIDGRVALDLWLPSIAGSISEDNSAWQTASGVTPDNPADNKREERDHGVFFEWPETVVKGGEIQQLFQNLFDGTTVSALVRAVGASPLDQLTLDIYAKGLGHDPTWVGQKGFILDPTVDLAPGATVTVKPSGTGAWYVTNVDKQIKYIVAISGFVGQRYWDSTVTPARWGSMEHVHLYGFVEVELEERAYDASTGAVIDIDTDPQAWATSEYRNFIYTNLPGGRWGSTIWPDPATPATARPAINLAEIHNWNINPTPEWPTPVYVYLTNINHHLYPRFFQPIPPSANEFGFWDYFLITELTEVINSKGHLIRYINMPGVHDGSC